MTVYLVFITILYICAFINFDKMQKALYWVMVSALAIVSGIRYYVGTDFEIQKNYYDWTVAGLTDNWLEPGFRLYIWFIEKCFDDFQMYIFIAAVFVVFSFGYAIYKNVEHQYQFFSLAIFVTSTIYFATMNLVRQYIAIAFLILSLGFLKEKKYIRTALLFLCAVSFHESAVCFLMYYLFYFWMKLKKNAIEQYRWINIVVVVTFLGMFIDIREVVSVIGKYVIPSGYLGYLDSTYFWEKDWDSILKNIFPNLFWIYLYFAKKAKFTGDGAKDIKLYIPGYILWIVINNLFFGINIFYRIGFYFEWFVLFLFPVVMGKESDKRSKFIMKAGILAYYFALTSYAILYNNGHGVMPYQTMPLEKFYY